MDYWQDSVREALEFLYAGDVDSAIDLLDSILPDYEDEWEEAWDEDDEFDDY